MDIKTKPAYTYKPSTDKRLVDLDIHQTSKRALKEYEWTPPGRQIPVPVVVWRCYGESQVDGHLYCWIAEAQFHLDYTRTLRYGLTRVHEGKENQ